MRTFPYCPAKQTLCLATFLLLTLAMAMPVFPQGAAASVPKSNSQGSLAETSPGVFVERVGKYSEAERAGLKEGDVLLSWSRGDAHGSLDSPFDFWRIEIEQRNRGQVKLQGISGTSTQSWVLNPADWDTDTRPNLTGNLLAAYLKAADLANTGRSLEAGRQWRALAMHNVLPHKRLASWFLLRSAEAFAEAGDWKEGIGSYQVGVDIAELPDKAPLLSAQANSFFLRKDYRSAARSFGQAIDSEAEQGHSEDLVFARLLKGACHVAEAIGTMAVAAAESYCTRALVIQQKIAPGSLAVAETLTALGFLEQNRMQHARAIAYYSDALGIEEHVDPDSAFHRKTLALRASAARANGEPSKTERDCTQANLIAKKTAAHDLGTAETLWCLGAAAHDRGDLDSAEKYFHDSLQIFEELQNKPAIAAMLDCLAETFLARGDLEKSEQYARRALAIQDRDPKSLSKAYSLLYLGDINRFRRNLMQANTFVEKALSIKQRLAPSDYDIVQFLDKLAEIAILRRDYDGAGKYLRRALAIASKSSEKGVYVAWILRHMGDFLQDRHDLSRAETVYRDALDILEKETPGTEDHVQALAGLAVVSKKQGKLDVAEQYYERAVAALESQTARLGGSSEIRTEFHAKYQSCYREYISVLLLRSKVEMAFEVSERSRAQTLLETLSAAHIDIRKSVDPDLLRKEHSLRGDLRAKSELRVHLLPDKQSEDQVKAVEREISTLTSEFQDVEARIRSSSPEYAALTQPQTLSAKEIQEQLLDPDTLLLEYSLGEERSHVFVVSADWLAGYDLPKRGVIEAQARRMYKLLTARNRRISGEKPAERTARIAKAEAEYLQAAARLSGMVLGPIADELAGKRLLIVSDGALHYVPFAAFPVRGTGKTTVPLMAEHEIVNLPSASVLAELRRERLGRQPAAKTVAVLADPVFDSGDARVKRAASDKARSIGQVRSGNPEAPDTSVVQEKVQAQAGLKFAVGEESLELAHLTRSATDVGWTEKHRGEVYLPRLPSTRREAAAIVSAAPAGQSFEALDFKANRATATSGELANYRIVHFATHALLNSKHPELSGLVLSLVDDRGRPQSGFLGLEDIYNLNLPAELVVLSACETALGKDIEGEGMVGLTRGFMYAGASRVMASLWNIDDQATADQMKYFYRAMVGQGMRPAAALRAAQLKMRQDPRWRSPYFWAAFQIQGEWK